MKPRFGPDPFDGKGALISQTPTMDTWVMEVTPGHWVKADLEWVGPILENNQDERNETAGRRWGDSQKVASIPLQFYYDHIVPARKQGDTAYVKKILNDPDFAKLRTKEGRI